MPDLSELDFGRLRVAIDEAVEEGVNDFVSQYEGADALERAHNAFTTLEEFECDRGVAGLHLLADATGDL